MKLKQTKQSARSQGTRRSRRRSSVRCSHTKKLTKVHTRLSKTRNSHKSASLTRALTTDGVASWDVQLSSDARVELIRLIREVVAPHQNAVPAHTGRTMYRIPSQFYFEVTKVTKLRNLLRNK